MRQFQLKLEYISNSLFVFSAFAYMSSVRAPSFVFSDAVNVPRIFVSVILNMITSNATFDRNLACNENLSYNFVHSFIKNVAFVSPISIGVKF